MGAEGRCCLPGAREENEMKLISWNVNGLRASMNKGFNDFFSASGADIFCVQETKMQPEQANFSFDGYTAYWNSAVKKGYSGTAVFTRIPPLSVSLDLGPEEHSGEGRVITMEFETFYLVNVYAPNSQPELARLSYRMSWEDAFRDYVMRLDREKSVIICGDMNVPTAKSI
jgi:exodeoxyribonuclease-3